MPKLKIAHVLHCVGGLDIYLRLLLENINHDKIETIVIHGEKDLSKPFDKEITAYSLPIFRNISPISDLRAIYKAYNILKKEKPELIHCHSAKGGIIGRLVGRMLNIKTIYTPHAFSYLSANNGIKKAVFLFIEKVFSNGNSVVLGTSKSEMERAVYEVGYKPNKAFFINNAINLKEEASILKIPKIWPDKYICTVGRPSYQKNIELMITVLKEVLKTNNIHLIIMGVGHHSDRLDNVKKMLSKLKIEDKVTLIDWTDRKNILYIIKNAQLYISTARYEGMPYSVIESLSFGKPCVVSNCDGNKDVIVDDYNGYLIGNEDIKQYTRRITELLNNKETLERLSKNARTAFEENHNLDIIIKKTEAFYSKIHSNQNT